MRATKLRKKKDEHVLEVQTKQRHKVLDRATYTVSADGKTLTVRAVLACMPTARRRRTPKFSIGSNRWLLESNARTATEPISVVILRGKLMLGEDCLQLEAVIPELLRSGRTKLIFDLSGVTHIDSTGIGRFIDTYSRLGK